MRIKEYRITETGDFDILVSFTHDEIENIGYDTRHHFLVKENFMKSLIMTFKRHFDFLRKKLKKEEVE